MKVLKFFVAIACLSVATTALAAENEKPVLSVIPLESGKALSGTSPLSQGLTATRGGVEIAFVEGATPIVGLQFDLRLKDAALAVKRCNQRLATGHTLTCNDLQSDILRVIVFSTRNAVIRTGAVLSLPGIANAKLIDESVLMGDADAEPVIAEIL
jgi:hypothetical protein